MTQLSIVLLTGPAGCGKTTAARALEDEGFVVVDNLPGPLAPQLVKLLGDAKQVQRVALVMDARDPNMRDRPDEIVGALRKLTTDIRVVYLEATDEALLRRFSETRRKHPLDDGAGLRAAIEHERQVLLPLREIADESFDTSLLSPHELKRRIQTQIAGASAEGHLHLALKSFGFKFGIPLDADLVIDVRFLPNPYFVPELKKQTGLDHPVSDFVLGQDATREFLAKTLDYLHFLLPHYGREGKRYLTAAIGCTGGQHRSVAIVEALSEQIDSSICEISTSHRQLRKPTR